MAGQWFLERHGNLFGPYPLEQVRALVAAGQLRATDKVLQEGTSDLKSVSAVRELTLGPGETGGLMGTLPAVEVSQIQHAPPAPASKKRLRIGLGIALALFAVIVLVAFMLRGSDPENEPDPASPYLPEWFQRAHRIRPAQGKVVAVMREAGVLNPPKDPPPAGRFTASWFEKHFTHYLGRDAFIYAGPKMDFNSDGKIHAGIKVLLGEETRELALICICSETGRPINMYVRREALRERSKGPPRQNK